MISKERLDPVNSTTYHFGEFRLEEKNKVLFRNSEVVQLMPKAVEVLFALVEAQGGILTRQELLEKVWANSFVEEANLTHHISTLRKTLGEDKNGRKFIETIPRKGYRFVADVKKADEFPTEIIFSESITAQAFEEIEIDTSEAEEILRANENRYRLPPTQSSFKSFSKLLLLIAVCLLFTTGAFFAYQQWQRNGGMNSFEAIRPVRLTAWKSRRSNDYWDFKSSHNGNMIAYSSSRNGNPGIYVKQTVGGEDIRITKDEWDNSSPVWSPDDQQIAFASTRENQAGIYICPSLGGTGVLLKIIGAGTLSLRNWSKDGSQIFYEFNGNFYKLNIADKETFAVTDFPDDEKVRRFFRISPDEKKVVYREETSGQVDLWILEIAGKSKTQLTNDADAEVETAWNNDSRGIFYQVNRDKIFQISYIRADAGETAIQITRGDVNYELIDVSPDGQKLFYYTSEDKSDIGGVNVESGEQTELAGEPDSEFWADVSPDGKSISYLFNSLQTPIQRLTDSRIVIRSNFNQNTQNSFIGLNQKWLPDNRRIAFLRYDELANIYNLWTFDTIGGEEKQITGNGVTAPGTASFPYNRTQTHDFSWSNDSHQVAYISAKRQNVFLSTVAAYEFKNLTNSHNPNVTFYCPIWSPNAEKFAYVSVRRDASPIEKSKWSVWLYGDGETKEIYTTADSLRFLGWSSTGEELFFETAEGAMKSDAIDIKILQLSLSGKTKIVNQFEQISALSMALSSDARTVVFTKEIDGRDNIYGASINNSEIKKLTDNKDSHVFYGSLIWLPDNKNIYFDKQERINTISMFENLK